MADVDDGDLEEGRKTLEEADNLLEKLGGSSDNEDTQIMVRKNTPGDSGGEQLSQETEGDSGKTEAYEIKPSGTESQGKEDKDGTKVLRKTPTGLEESGEQPSIESAEEALSKIEKLPSSKEIKIMAAAKSGLVFLLSQLSSLSGRVYSKDVDEIITKPLAEGERYTEPDQFAIQAMFNDLDTFVTSFEKMEEVVKRKLPPSSIVELLRGYHISYEAIIILARDLGIKDEIKPENLAKKLREKIEEKEVSKKSVEYLAEHIGWQRNPKLLGFNKEKDRETYLKKETELLNSLKVRYLSQKTQNILNQYFSSDDETKERLDLELAEKIISDTELFKRFFGEGHRQYSKIELLEEEMESKLKEIKGHRKRDPLKWLGSHITNLRTGEYSKYFSVNREIPKLAPLWDANSEIHYGADDDYNKDVVDPEMARIMVEYPETWAKSTVAMLGLLHKAEKEEKQTVRKHAKLCAGLNTNGIVDVLYKDARELRNEEQKYQASVGKLRLAKDVIEKVADTREICPDQYPIICAELGSDLLYLAKEESNMGLKKTIIEESIENSKSAYESASGFKEPSQEVQQAKAIASHNLNYSYNLLASISSGKAAEEYQKEAGKYGSADKQKAELNIVLS
ncbi:hypothetical protein MBGDC06_00579 [Thermoplasmatales archaeon SCGC AB-539-C06]|nr:hypothetical protein MBGDC06_00579 [Thermoplasmatales archaeon SCGC AB-539-C06]